MKKMRVLIAIICLAIAGAANAAEVLVNADITASTTWTANNVYRLQKQVYVMPGATLTIEPGTLIQSTSGLGGSLAVTKGAKIYAEGTASDPIIFTSTADNLTSWHEGCNEWGNITIMGDALISMSYVSKQPANTATPTGLNVAAMEGLVADLANPTKTLYGGDNDNDDSGTICYVSLRYGGKVIGLNNELNGLSLGGIGRETDIHHIEIMNNVDDGIEVWGGTVNLSFLNIWNIGDDSLDIDQGYRGKIQFGLIVQGYSTDAAQGSGVGDNCIEIDGAENSDAQPVTTTAIYNFTVVGQPASGDHATAWRDNARVQYGNCIFMEIGEGLVQLDNVDGDGASGYGFNGTLSWADTWTTNANVYSTVNQGTWTSGAFNDPSVLYTAQQMPGKLAQIKDSVFHRINNTYTITPAKPGEIGGTFGPYYYADAVGVRDAANNNVTAVDADMPIQTLVRGAGVTKGGKLMLPVTYINPCAANNAVTSVVTAPNDGFFKPANFRGGFSANRNWLEGWTSVDAYRMTDTSMNTANGDINGDGIVDFADFAIFGADWLQVL